MDKWQEKVQDYLNNFEMFLKSERVKPKTITNYLSTTRRFLVPINGGFVLNDGLARVYLANMYEAKNNTVRATYYALRSFYRSQDIPFNISLPEGEANPYRPTLDLVEIQRLIIAVLEGGTEEERGVLSLSTTYGIRRVEIPRTARNDHTVTIRAAKGGRIRTHLIPDEIYNNLATYDFTPRSGWYYSDLFGKMTDRAGLDLKRGYGFHSIRRALYTGLMGKVNYFFQHEFMRWSSRELNLDMIYNQMPPAEIDKLVFAAHPFLKMWAGG